MLMADDEINNNLSEDINEIAHISQEGHLILPEKVLTAMGLTPGGTCCVMVNENSIQILPDIHSMARLYIEPTSRCNLNCQTCIRRTWKEPLGNMDLHVFDRLVDQLKNIPSLQSVMFGGFGEPTAHRDILYMIKRIKALGLKAEITTNGTLLNSAILKKLVELKLDTLWVSFDGTSEANFEDLRQGAHFKKVVDNLKLLQKIHALSDHEIQIGIAFVAMKQNVKELQNLGTLAETVRAKLVSVSNVLPYTEEMKEQALYHTVLPDSICNQLTIKLPRFDMNDLIKNPLFNLVKLYKNITSGSTPLKSAAPACRFIEDRCTFIRWDGAVSPCMGLLHSYRTCLNNTWRDIQSYSLGNISNNTLSEIWNSTEYHDFRVRVNEFSFSPCYMCGGCSFLEKNEEDCYGNRFPVCGGCLWAQGIIQCP